MWYHGSKWQSLELFTWVKIYFIIWCESSCPKVDFWTTKSDLSSTTKCDQKDIHDIYDCCHTQAGAKLCLSNGLRADWVGRQNSWSKGISKTKLKAQSPCNNCMQRLGTSRGDNIVSACTYCMHQPVMSWGNHMVAACTYRMGSKVSSLSRIYLYSFTPVTLVGRWSRFTKHRYL